MRILSYPPINNIWFYLLVIGALISLSTYTWQFRKTPGAKPQVCVQLCKGAGLLFFVLSTISTELPDKMFWINLQLMATAVAPYFWFAFVLEISNQDRLIPPIVKSIFPGIITCLCLVILSDPWHHLVWKQGWLEGQTLQLIEGYTNMAVGISSFTLSAITIGLSIRWIVITSGMHQRQAWWFTLVGLFSLLGVVLRFVPAIQCLSPMPLCYLLAGLFTTWGFYRWQVYNIFTLAEQTVIKNMVDGLLVVDEYGYIVELNPAAQTICKGLPAAIGGKFVQLTVAWPALAEREGTRCVRTMEVMREFTGENRYYRLQVTPLHIKDHLLGKTIVLQDITAQKHRQAQLIEQQKSAAIAQERANLARELHDDLYQVLGYLNVQSQSIMKFAADGKMSAAISGLSRLSSVSQKSYEDVQEYIRGVQVEKMADKGLAEALREYTKWVQETYGLKVDLDIQEDIKGRALESVAALQLMRIVQEALTNIRKHAEASHVRLVLNMDAAAIHISVADDGKGYNVAASSSGTGFGLTSMRERAEKVGAKLEITSVLGQGTHVVVKVPRLVG